MQDAVSNMSFKSYAASLGLQGWWPVPAQRKTSVGVLRLSTAPPTPLLFGPRMYFSCCLLSAETFSLVAFSEHFNPPAALLICLVESSTVLPSLVNIWPLLPWPFLNQRTRQLTMLTQCRLSSDIQRFPCGPSLLS